MPTKPRRAVKPKEPTTFLAVLDRAIRDKASGIEKVHELVAARNAEVARIAQGAFTQAMVQAQAEIAEIEIVRNAVNETTRSRYATFEALSRAIQPVITKAGFALSFSEGKAEKEGYVRILADVGHAGGHSKSYYAEVPMDDEERQGEQQRNSTMDYGSTVSYARRYLKLMVFDVAVRGEDRDGNRSKAVPTITAEQREELTGELAKNGFSLDRLLSALKVETLADLSADRFNFAQALIADRAKNTAKPS